MPTILFGSISTLVDTSELQREAFNDAFAAHELDWTWDQATYRGLLDRNGGARRIADHAAANGQDVDAEAVHATKSARFQELLAERGVAPREGVAETIRAAWQRGIDVGVVTTTSSANVAAILGALGPDLDTDDLAIVLDAEQVERPKPDPEVYTLASQRLGVGPPGCVAIEDNPGGVAAAVAAGITCIAFPNENTRGLDFDGAITTVDRLDLDTLLGHVEVAG
jgi:HAD superfamily hydrolase (TIGR01509 family)